nr:MAG TPA_asm: hypothetical protein [Caudoviricetes sp.]
MFDFKVCSIGCGKYCCSTLGCIIANYRRCHPINRNRPPCYRCSVAYRCNNQIKSRFVTGIRKRPAFL